MLKILLSLIIISLFISIPLHSQNKIKKHIDSILGYSVIIPEWFTVLNTGSSYIYGGTLPAINGIENAIVISFYDKTDFKSFADFKNEKIEKFKTGDEMAPGQIFVLRKLLGDIEKVGTAYQLNYFQKKTFFSCQMIFTENIPGYILIAFVATHETYNINLPKFEEFLKGFEIIRY